MAEVISNGRGNCYSCRHVGYGVPCAMPSVSDAPPLTRA